ncbi:MAG: hypothetical protein IKH60_03875 [Bacteroidales bacterium]|jgi:hypothetical protein|nr:hypothetical protein [Bacteroidales bacterium]
MKTKTKIITISSVVLVLALAAFVFFRFYFVFGEGVKAGQLNQVMYKGYIFKTYEGRLIQSGFKGQKGTNSIQSNEFNFSVVDKAVADSLMRCSGKTVELHYREYLGALPWRGMEKYIVDQIISVREGDNGTTVIPIATETAEVLQ